MASGITPGSLTCVLCATRSTEVYWHECGRYDLASYNHLGYGVD